MVRTALTRALLHPLAKPAVCLAALLPFAVLFHGALTQGLGPNPAEAVIRGTGDWALRMLCIALAVTPLRVVAGLPALGRLRRMLGLACFFYALLHFLSYAWLDMGFDPAAIARDIPKRPFALVGFLAFVLLLPLAATSFNRAMRALGARRWQALHRLVYAVAPLALLHFFWMKASKHLYGEVVPYALVLALLLGWRLWHQLRSRRLRRASAAAAGPAADRADAPAGQSRA